MNKLASIVAAALFGLTLAAASGAQAWKIRIDNYGNPDRPSSWGTNNTIIISVFNDGGVRSFTAGSIPGPTGTSGSFDIVVPSSMMTLAEAEWIAVGTSGSDLFVIDQIEIFDDSGTKYQNFGIDNMFGWCLSTVAANGNMATCGSLLRARQWYRFFLHTGASDPPRD